MSFLVSHLPALFMLLVRCRVSMIAFRRLLTLFSNKYLLAAIEPSSFGVDHGVVAKAYHDALLELEVSGDNNESLCIIWAPHIHVGA